MSINTLPNVSTYRHPTTGKTIMVMKGRSGYWPADAVGIIDDHLDPDVWNAAHDISKAEAEAMFSGSLWGWDVPAANPANYDADGNPNLKKWLDDRSMV